MTAASELCYHTVHCSALNAEELRRENGIEVSISIYQEENLNLTWMNFRFQILLEAYSRCVSIMSVDSNPSQVHYQIISNITKCFEVACNFENCKSKIIELPQLIMDVCRVVYFKVSFNAEVLQLIVASLEILFVFRSTHYQLVW